MGTRKQEAQTELLILQLTPFCNVNCSYCYLPDRNNKTKMSFDIIEYSISRVFERPVQKTPFTIVFHAGEPLTAPIDLFKRSVETSKRLQTDAVFARYNVQTNATLIDDAWADFFNKHAFQVGISIDGPKSLHDRFRVDRRGLGTFEAAMAGMEKLRAREIKFHAISVLTRAAIKSPDEFWQFFYELKPNSLCLNIEEVEGVNCNSSALDEELRGEFAEFISKLMNLWLDAGRPFRIREFESFLSAVGVSPEDHRQAPPSGNQTNIPLSIISVSCNGEFSTFSPELSGFDVDGEKFSFGSVLDGGFDQIFSSKRFIRNWASIRDGVEKCKSECSYFDLCRGGAPSNKFFENGTFHSSETRYCRTFTKTLIDTLASTLEQRFAVN